MRRHLGGLQRTESYSSELELLLLVLESPIAVLNAMGVLRGDSRAELESERSG